jgi:single-stranded DNA-binding protein
VLSVLISGNLTAGPKERRSAAGKAYATVSMRVPAEDSDAILVSVIAFNADVVDALLALAKGDSVSIAGRAKLSSWERDGEQRHGLSVIADRVLTPYAAGKQRKAARDAEQADALPSRALAYFGGALRNVYGRCATIRACHASANRWIGIQISTSRLC